MKLLQSWRIGIGVVDVPLARHCSPSRKPNWICLLIFLVFISLLGACIYPPQFCLFCMSPSSTISPSVKTISPSVKDWLPPSSKRDLSDDELNTQVVVKEILSMQLPRLNTGKIAFMFLTAGTLPFEKLWEKFLLGNEDKFSIFVHASKNQPVHSSTLFVNKDVRSDKVDWGKMTMVDAERRLLANALKDPANQRFVLLSDRQFLGHLCSLVFVATYFMLFSRPCHSVCSCVPLHDFDYVYRFLMDSSTSFLDCFNDPGPHGSGRYSERMLPEVEMRHFRKGSQWFAINRRHALVAVADNFYYAKFRSYCKPHMENEKHCYPDEHYLPTLFNMVDPDGIANWSVTHVDWSEGKWHPKTYTAQDISLDLFENITSIKESIRITSDEKRVPMVKPCMWNGIQRPCHLFARKFDPDALENLLEIFSSFSSSQPPSAID